MTVDPMVGLLLMPQLTLAADVRQAAAKLVPLLLSKPAGLTCAYRPADK
jgi:hypothetical protein